MAVVPCLGKMHKSIIIIFFKFEEIGLIMHRE